jgi:hypothetical protein
MVDWPATSAGGVSDGNPRHPGLQHSVQYVRGLVADFRAGLQVKRGHEYPHLTAPPRNFRWSHPALRIGHRVPSRADDEEPSAEPHGPDRGFGPRARGSGGRHPRSPGLVFTCVDPPPGRRSLLAPTIRYARESPVIEPASLTELRRAVDRCRRDRYDGKYFFEIYDAPIDQLAQDEEMFRSRPVSLELAHRYTLLDLTLVLARDAPAQDDREVAVILSHLLLRMGARLVEFTADTQVAATVYRASVHINPRGLTVGEALRMGADLLLLWEASVGGSLTPATAAGLVRAQRAELLIGQPESEWFEAKQAPYRLGDGLQEIELAKDVSALANRPEGGLLVIGLVTGKQRGRDVVTRVRTQPVNYLNTRRYRQSIDRWIYPRLRDVSVDTVEAEAGRGLLMVLIPPQPESLWPFLVCGAVVGKKILGNHFSLVRRRGDETVDDTAAVVHGLMVAGRVALSRAPRQATYGP